MNLQLTAEELELRAAFRGFSDKEIVPNAAAWDAEQRLPDEAIAKLGCEGYLGATIPPAYGGRGLSMIAYGLLHQELSRGTCAASSLLTVHGMVAEAIRRWGTVEQKEIWLPRMSSGAALGAFCLTEKRVGSDAKSVETRAEPFGDGFVVSGVKRWISFGEIADVYLVLARLEEGPSTLLVERDTQGLTISPMTENLGLRASRIAQVSLDGCRIPRANLVGRAGFGFSHVVGSALQLGRYSVAWSCVGIGQACLEAALRYSAEREQFGAPLRDHPLIKQMLTNMITEVEAARLLAYQAGQLADLNHPRKILATLVAKYFASRMANRVASDALQIHGANGCSRDYPVERHFRDARVTEIIEGSTQIHQLLIAGYGSRGYEPHGGLC